MISQIRRIYPTYIPNPTFVYEQIEDRPLAASSAAQAPSPPIMASERSVSSSISLMPMQAARHAGDLPMFVLTALSVRYYVKNMPCSIMQLLSCKFWTEAYQFTPSMARLSIFVLLMERVSRLISRQVQLNESNRTACHAFPSCPR